MWVGGAAHPQFAGSHVEPLGLCGVHRTLATQPKDRGRWETSFCIMYRTRELLAAGTRYSISSNMGLRKRLQIYRRL